MIEALRIHTNDEHFDTPLAIRKTEVANPDMHCDWSAEKDWEFSVSLTRRQ